MGFMVLFPYTEKRKHPNQLTTTNTFVEQAWRELTVLRHIKPKHISSPKLIASWIDQAHTYYIDSIHSNWRSAGLLYYYSFLNLAKALLVAKRKFSYKSLNTTAINHGLAAALQDISCLKDYQIQIFPPAMHSRRNVFSNFYQVVTGCNWAFEDAITIKLQDILGYCEDISVESQQLYSLDKKILPVQSLYREIGNDMWFEMGIPKQYANIIKSEVVNWNLQFVSFEQLNQNDKQDWLNAFQKTPLALTHFVVIRTSPRQFDQSTKNETFQSLLKEVRQVLEPYIAAPVYISNSELVWNFVPKLNIESKLILWHPVLSNYLMSFALATILRYQPQLLKTGSDNHFYAEAWCSQCAQTTLGYFLMLFTDPPIVLKIH